MAILSTEIPANRLRRLKFNQRHTRGRKEVAAAASSHARSGINFKIPRSKEKKKESLPFQLVQVGGVAVHVIDEKLSLGFPLLISAQLALQMPI